MAAYLGSGLVTDLLDFLELLVGGLLCVLLGLLVAAGVLFVVSRVRELVLSSIRLDWRWRFVGQGDRSAAELTSVSKVLKSDSFCDL